MHFKQVKGNCLECPFHGWRFNGDDGKCTHIPYTDAKSKYYICLSSNKIRIVNSCLKVMNFQKLSVCIIECSYIFQI